MRFDLRLPASDLDVCFLVRECFTGSENVEREREEGVWAGEELCNREIKTLKIRTDIYNGNKVGKNKVCFKFQN